MCNRSASLVVFILRFILARYDTFSLLCLRHRRVRDLQGRRAMGAEASKPGVAQAFTRLGKEIVSASDATFWKYASRTLKCPDGVALVSVRIG